MLDPRSGSDLPLSLTGAYKTPFGLVLPPGGKVAAFVSNNAAISYDESFIRNNLRPTLASALSAVNDGKGDTIIVLPGHSESVTDGTMLDNLKDYTRIIGVGMEVGLPPTFRWTATAANWALNNAGTAIQGLRLRMEGANGVVSAITCTGADCSIRDCDIETASGAANLATIGITVGAGADRLQIAGNRFRGTTNAGADVILVSGAALDILIARNQMICATTPVTQGLIRFSAAALRAVIRNNIIFNIVASGETAIACGAVAATGVIADNYVGASAGTPVSDLIEINAAASFRCFQNFGTDTANTSGLLTPAVVT